MLRPLSALVPAALVFALAHCDDETTNERPDLSAEAGAFDASSPPLSDASSPTADATTEAGDDGGADAGGDASVGPKPGDLFVNAQTGNDAATGAQGSPFKTIAKAMSVATAGKTVWLEDGTWNAAIDPTLGTTSAAGCALAGIVVPPGVDLRGVNAGAATIALTGTHGLCVGGSTLAGFRLTRTAGGGTGLSITGGVNRMEGVALANAGGDQSYPLVVVAGGAKLALTPNGIPRYTTGLGAAFRVEGNGTELTVAGGAFDDVTQAVFARASHLQVEAGSKLVLDGVRLERPPANQNATGIIGVNATGTVELRGNTVIRGFNSGHGLFLNRGATAVVTNTSVIEDNLWGILASGFGSGATSLTISGSATIRNNTNAGIRGDFVNGHQLDLTLSGTPTITGNGQAGIEYSAGTFTMTGGTVTANGTYGVILYTGLSSFSMRNGTVTNNALSGVYLQAFSGTADLGTTASPGGNTIRNNASTAGYTNLRVDRDGVTAIGNTWEPNVQGTAADGTFAPGPALELVGPQVNAGKNFWVSSTGHKLTLR